MSIITAEPVHEQMLIEVELRGELERIRWTPLGIEGADAVLARLGHHRLDLQDPVEFLAAVRRSFGEHVQVHVG